MSRGNIRGRPYWTKNPLQILPLIVRQICCKLRMCKYSAPCVDDICSALIHIAGTVIHCGFSMLKSTWNIHSRSGRCGRTLKGIAVTATRLFNLFTKDFHQAQPGIFLNTVTKYCAYKRYDLIVKMKMDHHYGAGFCLPGQKDLGFISSSTPFLWLGLLSPKAP